MEMYHRPRRLRRNPVIRDLVVDMSQFYQHYRAVKPYLIVHEPEPEVEYRQTPEW